MAAGVFGLLAGGAAGAPPAAGNGKTAAPTNPAAALSESAFTPQQFAVSSGTAPSILTGGAQRPGYYTSPSPTILGGWFGPASVGGTFQSGLIGGTMNGLNPPGGRLTNVIVGGTITPGFPPGGALTGRSSGGQIGPAGFGRLATPNYSYTPGPGGVIVGGAQPAGAAPGGAAVSGASPGGVIVGGAAPNTNPPGGALTGATGGTLH
jgi:hypothetical protein